MENRNRMKEKEGQEDIEGGWRERERERERAHLRLTFIAYRLPIFALLINKLFVCCVKYIKKTWSKYYQERSK